VLREVPIGRLGRPRPEADLANFELKHDVMVLFEQLEGIGDGQVGIKVERGLPVKLLYEIPAAK
jgi:hypothetical protein